MKNQKKTSSWKAAAAALLLMAAGGFMLSGCNDAEGSVCGCGTKEKCGENCCPTCGSKGSAEDCECEDCSSSCCGDCAGNKKKA